MGGRRGVGARGLAGGPSASGRARAREVSACCGAASRARSRPRQQPARATRPSPRRRLARFTRAARRLACCCPGPARCGACCAGPNAPSSHVPCVGAPSPGRSGLAPGLASARACLGTLANAWARPFWPGARPDAVSQPKRSAVSRGRCWGVLRRIRVVVLTRLVRQPPCCACLCHFVSSSLRLVRLSRAARSGFARCATNTSGPGSGATSLAAIQRNVAFSRQQRACATVSQPPGSWFAFVAAPPGCDPSWPARGSCEEPTCRPLPP